MPPAPAHQGNGPSNTPADDGSGKMVPLAALEAERKKRQDAETERARLEGQVGILSQTQPAAQPAAEPEPTVYTRAQLTAWVENGDITQEQANVAWDEQVARQTREEAHKTALAVVNDSRASTAAETELETYMQAVPALRKNTSEEFARVQAEYQRLVTAGLPATAVTTNAALRIVYGPAERLKANPNPDGDRETHTEVGGRGGGDDNSNGDGSPKGLSKRERDYYGAGIQKGIYKDWDEVAAELKFSDNGLRDRMKARMAS